MSREEIFGEDARRSSRAREGRFEAGCSPIFLDRERLMPSYVPRVLPHRESELRLLSSFYMPALENIEGAYFRPVLITGGVGTGKTCSVRWFGERFQEEAEGRKIDLRHVYMNCQLEAKNRFVFYVNLLEKVSPDIATRGVSPEEMIRLLIEYLRKEGKYLLISVDDIDYFCRRSKEHLVYDLTRLNEFHPGEPCPVVGVVFTAKDLSFHKRLEPCEVSTLGRCIIQYPSYTAEQIMDILTERVDEAFQPEAVSEEVLGFLADITAEDFKGDMRGALDLLLYAGNLAENLGCERILPEHLRQVHAKTYPWITTTTIANLSDPSKLILLGSAQALSGSRHPYLTLSEIRETYRMVCENHEVEPVDEEAFEEDVQDLCDRGILRMRSLLKFGISDVPAEELSRFLDDLITHLKSGLHET